MKLFGKSMKREVAGTTGSNMEPDSPKSGNYGDNAVKVFNASQALSVAAFHRAVELRAKTMSQLVMEYQTLSKDGGNYVLAQRGVARKINYLLQVQPNPTMTWSSFMQQAEIRKICAGNAVVYIERDGGGELQALWLCADASYDKVDNTYSVRWNGIGGYQMRTQVPATDVLHMKNTFTTDNGLWGMSVLSYAKSALSIAASNDKLTFENAAKGGKMKLIVQEEQKGGFGLGRAAKKELEKITDKLAEDIYQKDVVLLNNIANVTPISQSAQQQELLESRKFSVKEIARLTGVPPILLMDDSNSSYKSPEAATQEFLLRTIAPAIREWENEMNAKLLGPENYGNARFHLCEKSLMRLDPVGQANIDKIHLETGVMSVNELRAQYDLAQLENGDVHYVSTSLAEVGSAKLRQHEGDSVE